MSAAARRTDPIDALLHLRDRIRSVERALRPAITTTWTPAPLEGSWANYGSGYGDAGYYRDAAGHVHLTGVVKGGSGVILYLPVGFRPFAQRAWPANGDSALAQVEVHADGTVELTIGTGAVGLTLDQISFRAEQ